MSKQTRIGLSTSVLGMICFIVADISLWYCVAFMVFLLIYETNENVRFNAVQAVLLSVTFFFINTAWGCLGNVLGQVPFLDWYARTNFLTVLINTAESIVFIVVALLTLLGQTIEIPIIGAITRNNIKKEA